MMVMGPKAPAKPPVPIHSSEDINGGKVDPEPRITYKQWSQCSEMHPSASCGTIPSMIEMAPETADKPSAHSDPLKGVEACQSIQNHGNHTQSHPIAEGISSKCQL
jgi:hypothetical protein